MGGGFRAGLSAIDHRARLIRGTASLRRRRSLQDLERHVFGCLEGLATKRAEEDGMVVKQRATPLWGADAQVQNRRFDPERAARGRQRLGQGRTTPAETVLRIVRHTQILFYDESGGQSGRDISPQLSDTVKLRGVGRMGSGRSGMVIPSGIP